MPYQEPHQQETRGASHGVGALQCRSALLQVLGLGGVGRLGGLPAKSMGRRGVERAAMGGSQGGQVHLVAQRGAVMEAGGGGERVEAAVLDHFCVQTALAGVANLQGGPGLCEVG